MTVSPQPDIDLPVPSLEDALPGQAAYTRVSLLIYDLMVLGFSNRFLWGCRTEELLKLYDGNVGASHLDVGVATGFFLDRCRFPVERPRLALLDLNQTCLDTAARRVARFSPEIYRANVLQPVSIEPPPFQSIAMMYLLHCLPGPMTRKAAAFGYLKAHLAPGGRFFGATVLGRGVTHNALGRRVMALYNAKGIFGNAQDDAESLRQALAQHFVEVELRVQGRVALFSASKGP